jgi:hypothetical protein
MSEDEVILSLFPESFEFICDLKSELEASMDELFWLDSNYNWLSFGSNCTNQSDATST